LGGKAFLRFGNGCARHGNSIGINPAALAGGRGFVFGIIKIPLIRLK